MTAQTHFSVPADDIRGMTIVELKELKRRWYEEARSNNYFADFAVVARVLGRLVDARYTKYEWQENGVSLFHDTYGGYMTVEVGHRRVCSTHDCDQFIQPGEWIDIIRARADEARLKESAGKAVQEDRERAVLLSQLGAFR